jgi:hypothetical protein
MEIIAFLRYQITDLVGSRGAPSSPSTLPQSVAAHHRPSPYLMKTPSLFVVVTANFGYYFIYLTAQPATTPHPHPHAEPHLL